MIVDVRTYDIVPRQMKNRFFTSILLKDISTINPKITGRKKINGGILSLFNIVNFVSIYLEKHVSESFFQLISLNY